MELSYLFYRLSDADFPLWTTDCRSPRKLDGWQLYEPGVQTREQTLYVLTRGQWEQLPEPILAPVLLISGRDVGIPSGIVVKEQPLPRVINFLSDIFADYQAMWLCARQRDPDLKELMNRIHRATGAGATLIGGNMEGIAWSEDLMRFPLLRDRAEASNIQTQMIWDRDFYDTQNNRDVFLLVNELIDSRPVQMLCCNIFLGSHFCARFALVYTHSWRTEYLRPIARELGQALTDYYRTSPVNTEVMQKTAAFFNAMEQILQGNRPEDLLELHQFGWYADQECIVYVFHFDDRFPMTVSREYLHNKLEEFLGECYITQRQEDILCICNWSISGISFSQSRERLVAFLSEYICKVGISNPFRDIFSVPLYIRQAQWGLKLGQQKNPMHWYHHFRDYTYEYALEQSISEFPVEDILMPQLLQLRKRDQERESHLFETLELYVRNKCNGQATAKQLFIHRTTFLYRMKQIEELTHLDVQDEEIYKRLLFSFELYRKKHPRWGVDRPFDYTLDAGYASSNLFKE